MQDLYTDAFQIYKEITEALIGSGLHISTMESCTAGLIASLLTDTEGSSAIMKGSFVTYSNEAKIACGVPRETIGQYGVYSRETAAAMAAAAKARYGAEIGVGVTGSFGNPDPANPDSVPGELYFAIALSDGVSLSDSINLSDTVGLSDSLDSGNGPVITTYYQKLPVQDSRFYYKLTAAVFVGQALRQVLSCSIRHW